jgi:hypothetical protein
MANPEHLAILKRGVDAWNKWRPHACVRSRMAHCFPVTVVAGACGKDTYRPVYYPNKDNLADYTRGPSFANLAQARQWIEDQHARRRDTNWDHEIGKNCRPYQDTDVEICKETLK